MINEELTEIFQVLKARLNFWKYTKFMINEELTEIFKVKGKAKFPKT